MSWYWYWLQVFKVFRSGPVDEWLACWTRALSGNSLRQSVHTHCASVHQAAKLVSALLRVVRVTTGLVESSGSLPPGLWLTSPAGWLPRTGIGSGTLRSVIEYGLPLPFLCMGLLLARMVWMWLLNIDFSVFRLVICLQCFDAVGWAAGRASGL